MKYNIENNIDFYKELYGSLNEDMLVEDENIQLCLITNLPLDDRFVKLKCGHKFNYEPLYKDISNHKKKFNNMEQIKTRLKYNQIRCPYCRNVQDDLLPYYDDMQYPKEHGVNYFDTNKINNYYSCIGSSNECQYEISNVDASGNVQLQQCTHYGYTHYILKTKYNNTNKYCYSHKVIVVNETKEKIKTDKEKQKLELKQKKLEEKNKLKEELKEKKLAEKLKKMQLKQQSKIVKTPSNVLLEDDSENIILVDNINISNSQPDDIIKCVQTLKTGKNMGLPCAKKVYKDCLCKRHFTLNISLSA